MSFLKTALLLFFIATGVSCSSLAHREYACKESKYIYYRMGWLLVTYGNVLQQGECAIIEPLRFDLGEYYHDHHGGIEMEVRIKDFDPKLAFHIQDWGKALNCSEDALIPFASKILENKQKIFKSFDYFPRTYTKEAIKIIHDDPYLSKECKI